jgi:hypothetical protein
MENIDSSHHGNRYKAEPACEHCEGVEEHESWCATQDGMVHYAYGIVAEAAMLTAGDVLRLHALGIVWANVH